MAAVVDVEAVRAETCDLLAACDTLRAAQADVAARLESWLGTEWWHFDGSRSAEEWLGLFAQLDGAEARRLTERARVCGLLPAFAVAYRAGEIAGAHLDALARAVGNRRAECAQRDEDALLDTARNEAAPTWERTIATWRQHCDRELARQDAEEVWADRRFLMRPDLFGGVGLTGRLDPDGAAALSAAITAHRNTPDPAGGPPRTLARRNADALVALATSDEAVSVTVVIDHDLARTNPTCDDGSSAPVASPSPGGRLAPRADVGGTPIPAATAERLLCGASICTVTRSARSILDVTAATPTITVGQRRALHVRDPVCAFPGCQVIAHRCDIHHLRHRSDGGQHRLDNLVHLCRHHHRFLHESGWTTTGTPNTELHFHPPPGWDHEWLERAGITPPRE
ncbi:MAG: DUF222 domain-containing protein [Actinomycetota bacterium]